MGGLLEPLDGDPAVDGAVGDVALVRALLDVEAALARAVGDAHLVPEAAAEDVARVAAALDVDADKLGQQAVEAGNPVVPLMHELLAAVPAHAQVAVHYGATSQDIMDTGLQLLAHRALEPVVGHLEEAGDAAARLAEEHRGTLMVARTLGQPAQPSTFGLRAAGWLGGLDAAHAELVRVRERVLAVQLGGAAGTMAGYGPPEAAVAAPSAGAGSVPPDGGGHSGLAVAAHVADQLGLADPVTPWHTDRHRVHALGAALGSAVAACGKVAADVVLQSQAEIAEVAEGSPGGSSAMAHKRNPTASVLLLAAARRAPGLVATLLASGVHEQDRSTGSWHAEWQPLRDLLRLAGGAAARTASILHGLRVDAVAMWRNLDAAAPGVLSESLTSLLVPVLGRAGAQRAVRRALEEAPAGGADLVAALRRDPDVARAVSEEHVVARLDPAAALGGAAVLVDHHLRRHADGAGQPGSAG